MALFTLSGERHTGPANLGLQGYKPTVEDVLKPDVYMQTAAERQKEYCSYTTSEDIFSVCYSQYRWDSVIVPVLSLTLLWVLIWVCVGNYYRKLYKVT